MSDNNLNKTHELNNLLDTIYDENPPNKTMNNTNQVKVMDKKEFYKKIDAPYREYDSYYNVVTKKIKLNIRLIKFFKNNFYSDEFTNSRNSLYCIFAIPTTVIFAYLYFNPHHPLRNMIVNFSLLASIISFIYSFNDDISDLAYSGTPLGNEVKNIKNEIGYYNPFSKIYTDK